jgi:hypothetical protein
MKFKITWENGRVEEIEQSDCNSVEQFVNCRFGSRGVGNASVVVAGAEKPEAKKPVKKDKGDGAIVREE